jgi:hypothetical protein
VDYAMSIGERLSRGFTVYDRIFCINVARAASKIGGGEILLNQLTVGQSGIRLVQPGGHS